MKIFLWNDYLKDVINKDNQFKLIQEHHDSNHRGITETYKHLKEKYFWSKM